MRSQLEIALEEFFVRLRQSVRSRDRAVVLGVILSCIPVFPACLLGAVVCLMNLLLISSERLPRENLGLARLGLVVGAVFTSVWLFALIFINPFELYSSWLAIGWDVVIGMFDFWVTLFGQFLTGESPEELANV